MHLITSAQGSDHIYPIDAATIYRAMTGLTSCVFDYGDKFAPTIASANSITIGTGIGMIQGRMFSVTGAAESVSIANGTQGMKRIDLICMKVTKNSGGTQTGSWHVVQGTPDADNPQVPTYTEGNLDGADTVGLFALIRVNIENVSITSATAINTPIKGAGFNTLPIDRGGTGVTSLSALMTLLGLGEATHGTIVSDSSGGIYITRVGRLRIIDAHGYQKSSSSTIATLGESDRPPTTGIGGNEAYGSGYRFSGNSSYPGTLRIANTGVLRFVDQTSGATGSGSIYGMLVYWV